MYHVTVAFFGRKADFISVFFSRIKFVRKVGTVHIIVLAITVISKPRYLYVLLLFVLVDRH